MHDAKSPEEVAQWHRWFAIECNNRAWKLAESTTRTAAETEEMLHAAHAAALHWNAVGTEHNRALATMLLALAHGLAGDGPRAMRYANETHDYMSSRESAAWEIAFSHAILACGAAANGDAALHARHYERAKGLGAALPAEEREVFDRTFRAVPVPAR